jgi:predicted DNA-binding transcriptional regulator AlpA
VKRQQALQSVPSSPQQTDGRAQLPTRRCYSAAEIIAFLGISESGFFKLKKRNKLPFLQELKPRLSARAIRYRADLVDRYLAGEWESTGRHFFGSARHVGHLPTRQTSTVSPDSRQLATAQKGVRP